MFSKLEFILHAPLSLIYFIIFGPIIYIYKITQPFEKNVSIDMTDAIAIITGSNTGIGEKTALNFARRGATVVLACRSLEKGLAASKRIQDQLDNSKINKPGNTIVMELNLSDLESVENFTKIFTNKFNKLDVLVNNAGINVGRKLYDGIEELFVTNYLGHYLLFRKLSPLLTSKSNSSIFSSESRVINLSSVMHHTGSPDYTSSAFGKGSTSVYDDTKLYMNLLTIEINKRFQEKSYPNESSSADTSQTSCTSSRSIRAISANPGAVKSDIWRNVPKEIMWIYQIFMNIFYLTPEQGSETSVYAALCKFDDLNFPSSSNYSNKWCSNIYLPYLIPYYIPFRSLAFEMIGIFSGPKFGEVSLPDNSTLISSKLWDFSEELCEKILKKKNLFVS